VDDVSALVAQDREHYLQHFRAFVEIQRGEWSGQGATEAMFEVPEPDNLFRRLYRVDFALMDDEQLITRELAPDSVLTFEPFTTKVRNVAAHFERLEWNDVVLEFDGPEPEATALNRWFEHWFDPDEVRADSDAGLCQSIHALFTRPGFLCVDFGTATPEAFWELLELVVLAGTSSVHVTCQEGE
jgi:hypothetical protein